MGPRQAEVVPYAAGIERVPAFDRADKRPVAVRADHAVRIRPAVMEFPSLTELFIRIKTQVQRIQETSVYEAEPDPADRQFILQGQGIQPREALRTDLPGVKGIILPAVPAQAPVPVARDPVGAVRPDPVAGFVAFRALPDRVPEKPDVIRPDFCQFLFHCLCRDHVSVEVCQQHDFHFRHPAVQLLSVSRITIRK